MHSTVEQGTFHASNLKVDLDQRSREVRLFARRILRRFAILDASKGEMLERAEKSWHH